MICKETIEKRQAEEIKAIRSDAMDKAKKSCGYAQRKIQRQEGDIVRFYSQKRLPPYFYTEAEKIFEMIANTIDIKSPFRHEMACRIVNPDDT